MLSVGYSLQSLCHETSAEILECQGRTVEQFQCIGIFGNFYQRGRESKGTGQNFAEIRKFIAEEITQNNFRSLYQREIKNTVNIRDFLNL